MSRYISQRGWRQDGRLDTLLSRHQHQERSTMPGLLYDMDHTVGEAHAPIVVPDFGDVQDNDTALHIALGAMAHGESTWGCEVLRRLREHIQTTREVQSIQWILPQVEVALQGWCTHTGTLSRSADPLLSRWRLAHMARRDIHAILRQHVR
jgi:hypothetical protein